MKTIHYGRRQQTSRGDSDAELLRFASAAEGSQKQRSKGGGEGGEGGEGGGDGEDSPFSDADSTGSGECGDTGVIPGGVGGMGQAGECISGGGGGSASESGGASGGGASGGGNASGGGGAAGDVGQFPEESPEERAERLGRELDESIGGFDESLQEEQQAIASVGRSTEGYDTEGEERSGGVVSLGSQGGGAAGGAGRVAGAPGSGVAPEIDGLSQDEIEARTPDDIPVLVDDDIIARQLREAAVTEEDPVLRERLWEEYRKYQGISTNN